MLPPQRARACTVGLVTGPHTRTPRTHSQWVVGPGRTPERTRGRRWESARPRTPHTQARGAPRGHPHAAPTAHRSARCRAGDGSPSPHPPHPQPVGSGPGPHARTDERSGVGERPSPDAPHPGKRRPPRAPSGRPHSTQERALWARTDRNRDTRVAEPRLPAPEDGPPGKGQRLTPNAPHKGGRPPPPGTVPDHPPGTQARQGMQAKGTVLGT